jgi:DNA-binding IclR family transcriptional regulator
MDSKEEIEKGIGSLGKIKIIKALAEESKLATIYLLHKKTHLKRDDIKKNLDDLVNIGWVRQSKYANVMYSINPNNRLVSLFIAYLKEIGYIEQID